MTTVKREELANTILQNANIAALYADQAWLKAVLVTMSDKQFTEAYENLTNEEDEILTEIKTHGLAAVQNAVAAQAIKDQDISEGFKILLVGASQNPDRPASIQTKVSVKSAAVDTSLNEHLKQQLAKRRDRVANEEGPTLNIKFDNHAIKYTDTTVAPARDIVHEERVIANALFNDADHMIKQVEANEMEAEDIVNIAPQLKPTQKINIEEKEAVVLETLLAVEQAEEFIIIPKAKPDFRKLQLLEQLKELVRLRPDLNPGRELTLSDIPAEGTEAFDALMEQMREIESYVKQENTSQKAQPLTILKPAANTANDEELAAQLQAQELIAVSMQMVVQFQATYAYMMMANQFMFMAVQTIQMTAVMTTAMVATNAANQQQTPANRSWIGNAADNAESVLSVDFGQQTSSRQSHAGYYSQAQMMSQFGMFAQQACRQATQQAQQSLEQVFRAALPTLTN